MGKGWFAFAGLIGLLALLLRPVPAAAGIFNPITFTLDNGLEVVVIPDHRAPVVSHMVWYKVGAADEAIGKSGIAHFLEHLMFKGTDKIPPGEFSRIVARNGGNDNAFTTQDYTAYFQNVARDKLDLVVGMEADRMANLKLSEESVRTEREVVREERRQRSDQPGDELWETMDAVQYLHHPYGIPVIGWDQEIRQLSRKDAIDFYRRYYAPNNAILIVAGDVTAEEVKGLAEKHFGPIPRGPEIIRHRPQEPPQLAARRVILTDERVRQPSLRRTYLAPSRHTDKSNVSVALRVFTDILGGSSVSRLYQALVVERKLASSAGSSYYGLAYDQTTFGLYATPVPGGDLETLEAALDQVLAKVLAEGVTPAELKRAKDNLLASIIYARDDLGSGPRILGAALCTGLDVEDVESWPEEIERITIDDVMAAARQVLDMRRSVTGLLMPKSPS